MNMHLSEEEALAIQELSINNNWAKFMSYIAGRFEISTIECRTTMSDHRFHQGMNYVLHQIMRIEESANNILSGI